MSANKKQNFLSINAKDIFAVNLEMLSLQHAFKVYFALHCTVLQNVLLHTYLGHNP